MAPSAQPAAPGSLSSTQRPNPQTQEKPELAQLASTQASCPSVCGWASCWRKGGLQLCSDIPGWRPGTSSWHPTELLRLPSTQLSVAFPGTLGSGCENCKRDPLATEEAVNKTPKYSSGLSQAAKEHGSQTCHTPDGQTPAIDSQKPTASITCKPPPVFLCRYTMQLPCTLKILVTESRHQGNIALSRL